MAYLDSAHFDQKPASPVAWEALMAQLDSGRIEIAQRRPAPEAEAAARLRRVLQMLVAAALASGTIVTVAAVMMIKFL